MGLDLNDAARTALAIVVYATLGAIMLGVACWLVARSLPFSLRKEIAEHRNAAAAIVMGAVLLGVAMILSAVARG